MNPIVYIDGDLADHIGGMQLQQIANQLASLAGRPVDVLTYGASTYHGKKRVTGHCVEQLSDCQRPEGE